MNNFLPKAVIEPLKWCDAVDPDYALAHAELAIATSLLSVYSDLDKNDAVAQAEPHVERALALDPMLAEAHAAAGRLIKTRDGYTAEGSSLYEKAVQLNPNYTEAWVWLSTNYRYSWPRQYDKSFNAIRIAAQLDPLSSIALAEYINALVQRNKFAEADIELAKLASIKPSLHANLLGFRMSMGGNWASAALGLLNSRLLEPQDLSHRPQLSFLLAVLRLEKEAIAVFDPPRWNVYYHLGRVEDALRIFEARLAEDPESEDAQEWVWDIRVFIR